MTRALHITADPTAVCMARSIRAAASVAPLMVLTTRALGELAHELGGMGAAAEFLLELAEANNRPIGVNLAAADDSSKTVFIAPRTWTDERLRGWIGGHGAQLEAEFGEVSRVGAAFPAAGGAGMTHPADWRCRACGALLGRVRDGVLWPLVRVELIDGTGVALLRCPRCQTARHWFSAACAAAVPGQPRPPDRPG